jgi:glycosyltransferase involved in cell wall biosynthesis
MTTNRKVYCFVSNLSFNEEPTVKNRLSPYIKKLNEKGFKVILVSRDSKPINNFDDNLFLHISHPEKKNRPCSFLKRAIFEWSETRKLLKKLHDLKCDLIILSIPSMFLLFNSYILKNKKLALDVRDLTWEYLENNKLSELFTKLFLRLIASKSYKNFSSIIVNNHTEVEYFKRKKLNTLLYANGVSEEQYRELSTLPKKKNKKFTVSYVGKVGIAQNLETLIYAAELIEDVQFNIVGHGSEYERLQNLILTKKLTNISCHGLVNWKKVLFFYRESDVLYAQLKNNFSGAVPSKLYQYLNSKRFIIYGGGCEAKKTLSNFSHNVVIPPCDVNELVKTIKIARNVCNQELNFNNNLKIIKNNFIRESSVSKIITKWLKI